MSKKSGGRGRVYIQGERGGSGGSFTGGGGGLGEGEGSFRGVLDGCSQLRRKTFFQSRGIDHFKFILYQYHNSEA